jgi:hypothetical protein
VDTALLLATQALVEGDCEAFLDRARRAADAFDRAGAAAESAVERASLGAGYPPGWATRVGRAS